jgi:ribosomal protein S18 acetylase RimI-like enzyme
VDPAKPGEEGFIYDLRIFDRFQRRGYGRAALLALELLAKELGVARLRLHVFGHNQRAIALYQQAGYTVTNLIMTKDLPV